MLFDHAGYAEPDAQADCVTAKQGVVMEMPRLLLRNLSAVLALGVPLSGCLSDGEAATDPNATVVVPDDSFTPLVASVATPSVQPLFGTDGKAHLVYEIRLANTRAVPATLQRVTVVDASDTSRVRATFEGADLAGRLRSLSNRPGSATIELDSTRLLLVDVDFENASAIPSGLVHRLDLLGASVDATVSALVQQTYTAAPLTADKPAPLVIGPPLAGAGWVAFNGCCAASGVHRGTGLPVNGAVHYAQRFAIDWLRMDAQGRIINGNLNDVRSYPGYGADILAVADGTVVGVLDTLDDQVPPNLPDPSTINLKNVDGNHVVLDLGQGRYAFYAHMQKGSVTVRLGQRVTRGQVLGRLGNTGNSSAPHLHFHIMDSPSVLGSSGLPYVIDTFTYAGLVPESLAASFGTPGASWSSALFPDPTRRTQQFPMDMAIIDF